MKKYKMDFEKKVKSFKNIHLIILISFTVCFLTVWVLLDVRNFWCAVIETPQLVMLLQYAGIFLTLGGIVFGYQNYSRILKINKEKSLDIRHAAFIDAKKVQNCIIYFLFLFDILLFMLTGKKQFELLTAVSLIVSAVNFPSKAKYLRDYEETEEDYETSEEEISDSNS